MTVLFNSMSTINSVESILWCLWTGASERTDFSHSTLLQCSPYYSELCNTMNKRILQETKGVVSSWVDDSWKQSKHVIIISAHSYLDNKYSFSSSHQSQSLSLSKSECFVPSFQSFSYSLVQMLSLLIIGPLPDLMW